MVDLVRVLLDLVGEQLDADVVWVDQCLLGDLIGDLVSGRGHCQTRLI